MKAYTRSSSAQEAKGESLYKIHVPHKLSAWITLAVIALMIVGLLQDRLTPDTLVLGALVLLVLFGVIAPGAGGIARGQCPGWWPGLC